MKKTTIAILILVFIDSYSFSQDNFVMWNKISPEIRLNFENNPFEFRWRPVDYFLAPNIKYGRTDIMLGVKFGAFKIFNYSKFDEFGRIWTGVRFDLNLSMFDNKLLINIQERYFFGLNKKSFDQFYYIDFIMYRITKKIYLGVLKYGQWYVDRAITDGLFMIGPIINIILPHNFNLLVTSGNEIFHEGRYITIFRLGYRILWKNQNKPINFEI